MRGSWSDGIWGKGWMICRRKNCRRKSSKALKEWISPQDLVPPTRTSPRALCLQSCALVPMYSARGYKEISGGSLGNTVIKQIPLLFG